MENLEYIMMTTVFGDRNVEGYAKAIPGLNFSVDESGNAMANFLKSMRMTCNPCLHLEDDIILCKDFIKKVNDAIDRYPNRVINFFSLRKEDYLYGRPHECLGGRYMNNQCFYLPRGYGPMIAEYYKKWPFKQEHPTGYDLLMASWLKGRKEKYIAWFPHLVNHIEGKSIISHKRSSKRIDKYFVE